MKIIKKGNPQKTYRHKFVCRNCGCEFRAKDEECKVWKLETIDVHLCVCPCCEEECVERIKK